MMTLRAFVRNNVIKVILFVIVSCFLQGTTKGEGCEHFLNSPQGFVTSQNLGARYPDSKECIWRFETTPGTRIKLILRILDVQPYDNCTFNYFAFYDGNSTKDSFLGKFCGNYTVHNIIPTTHKMLMVLHSDESVQFIEFRAFYSTGCDNFVNTTEGFITSPNYPNPYPALQLCIWEFQTTPGKIIKLSFDHFEVEYSTDCWFDFVAIYDGATTNDTLLGKYCGRKLSPLMSTSHRMMMIFLSDGNEERKGFRASFSTESAPKNTNTEIRISDVERNNGNNAKESSSGLTFRNCLRCKGEQFRCLDPKCIRRSGFCDGIQDCAGDEFLCNRTLDGCPVGFNLCATFTRCFPEKWQCDGFHDCPDGSDEKGCQSSIRSVNGVIAAEKNLNQYFARTWRQQAHSIDKWGTLVTRMAVALFLNDQSFFAPGNQTGEEIAQELSLKLLSKLILRRKVPTKDLPLFINALTVACIDPKDFFGMNLVEELRKYVNNSNNTNPFYILTLCNAKDTMTTDDVLKLQQLYDAYFRPGWTDTQAMVIMALSCIHSRSDLNLDERILDEMVSELKRKQHRHRIIDNLKTTALVIQALIAAGNYGADSDVRWTVKLLVDEMRRNYPNIQDIFYILPIFNTMSMVNISSDHCATPIKTGLNVINNLSEHLDERIQVQISVIVGDDADFSRTWKVKIPSNYSFYQVLENIGILEPAFKLQYTVSDGKPYVTGLANFQDDTENGLFWFIYTKPLSSAGNLKLVEQSPVDIQVKESEELVLWYRSGYWANDEEGSCG